MQSRIEQFFKEYVANFNQALGDAPDLERIRATFAPCFVAAGPAGVSCGQNDGTFARSLKQGYEFYRSIGTREMRLRGLDVTPIDALHAMVKVHYGSSYQREDLAPVDIDFEVTYLLHFVEDTPQIFAYVTGDEMTALREAGVVREDAAA
jgi:hypothetical protein